MSTLHNSHSSWQAFLGSCLACSVFTQRELCVWHVINRHRLLCIALFSPRFKSLIRKLFGILPSIPSVRSRALKNVVKLSARSHGVPRSALYPTFDEPLEILIASQLLMAPRIPSCSECARFHALYKLWLTLQGLHWLPFDLLSFSSAAHSMDTTSDLNKLLASIPPGENPYGYLAQALRNAYFPEGASSSHIRVWKALGTFLGKSSRSSWLAQDTTDV